MSLPSGEPSSLKRETELSRVLNLGCGKRRIAGALNVDVASDVSPDRAFDLDVIPWPLPRNWFNEVIAFDVVEHLANVPTFFQELHEVCTSDALIRITVPHFSNRNAFTDPTHRHYFGLRSFDYFVAGHDLEHYSKARFIKESVTVHFEPTLVNKAVWRLARRFPERWEAHWAWMFPGYFLDVRLRVKK